MVFNELYEMELHDILEIGRKLEVVKVPGGWIYVYKSDKGAVSEFVSSRKGSNV